MNTTSTKNIFEYANELSSEIYKKIIGLMDETDTDLHIHENGEVYKKDIAGNRIYVGKGLVTPEEIMALGALLATRNETVLNMKNPMLDAYIPYDGARIHIDIPPITPHPVLDLRITHKTYRNLDALEKMGMFTKEERKILEDAVKNKKNIIISGETGSGKTTLLQALINAVDPTEHILVIEDTREIHRASPYEDRELETTYMTTSQWAEAQKCVSASLRKDPDRIIYGEVRDKTALDLIESWNTGHPGMGTVHANSCEAVITRFTSLCGQASQSSQEAAIREALDVIIQIEVKMHDGKLKRRIAEIRQYKK